MPSMPPPIPRKLREMLADYPEHMQRLQEALNTVVETPSKVTPPLEAAIWALESRLGAFVAEARKRLRTAVESGDADAISSATEQELLMSRARSVNGGMSDLEELRFYFDEQKGL